jgi:hypothetical protein
MDQRGISRNAATRGTCDIGAWDAGAPSSTLYVSVGAKGDPACGVASRLNPFATVAGALACAGNGSLVKLGAGRFQGGFTVSHNVTLQGAAGAGATVVSSPGAAPSSLTEITDAAGTQVVLRDLTVDGGNVSGQAGERDIAASTGSLSLIGVTVQNGTGAGFGISAGGVTISSGSGGVALSLLDSSVVSNFGSGGGVYLAGAAGAGSSLSVANSTIAGDEAFGSAAGGVFASQARVSIASSTIDGNRELAGVGVGGALLQSDTGSIVNSVIAGNSGPSGADCSAPASVLQDGGHNLVGVAALSVDPCSVLANGQRGDLVGTVQAPLAAGLAALAANGGLTPTQAPNPGSPAIDAGDPVACQAPPVSNMDQRGISRNAATRGTCDIGAWDA